MISSSNLQCDQGLCQRSQGGIQLIMVNPACTLLESCHERQGKQVQVTCLLSSAHYRTFLAKGRISGFLQSYSKHFGVRANPTVSLTRVVPFNCGSGLKQILEKGSLSKRVVVELWSLFCFEFFRIFWVQMDADFVVGTQVQTSSPPSCGFAPGIPLGAMLWG